MPSYTVRATPQKCTRFKVHLMIATVVCIGTTSCVNHPPLYKKYAAPSREVAAAVTVSATDMPWQRIATSVEPNFTISGNSALGQVAPITARINQQVLSALAANAEFGFAHGSAQLHSKTNTSSNSQNTSSNTSTSNTSTAAGGKPPGSTTTTTATGTNGSTVSVTTTTNSTSQPITASTPAAPTGVPAAASALSSAALSGSPSVDPMLKYEAALALYQDVQLMNNEVQNIASRRCYVPYMVQLKIGVLPYRHYLPYDLHARISFFPGKGVPLTHAEQMYENGINLGSAGASVTTSGSTAASKAESKSPKLAPFAYRPYRPTKEQGASTCIDPRTAR